VAVVSQSRQLATVGWRCVNVPVITRALAEPAAPPATNARVYRQTGEWRANSSLPRFCIVICIAIPKWATGPSARRCSIPLDPTPCSPVSVDRSYGWSVGCVRTMKVATLAPKSDRPRAAYSIMPETTRPISGAPVLPSNRTRALPTLPQQPGVARRAPKWCVGVP